MRVYHRSQDTPSSPSTAPNSKAVASELLKVMQDKTLSEAERNKAFQFFYTVPPSQRDNIWVQAASYFLKTVNK